MAGGFGYELDPGKLSEEEKERIRAQIARFRRYADLLREGDYYRIGEEEDPADYAAWQVVSRERDESLLSLVLTHPSANPAPLHLRFRGLDPEARYTLRLELFDAYAPEAEIGEERVYTGSALLYAGFTFPRLFGDYPGAQIHLKKIAD